MSNTSKKPKKLVGKIKNIGFQQSFDGSGKTAILADFYSFKIDGKEVINRLIVLPEDVSIFECFKYLIFYASFTELHAVSIDVIDHLPAFKGLFWRVKRLTVHFE